jgi:hypothetical protein
MVSDLTDTHAQPPLTGGASAVTPGSMMRRGGAPPGQTFEELQASVLFCGRCRAPQPVRERLLLVLPDGELHEYLCRQCGESVGKRKLSAAPPVLIG